MLGPENKVVTCVSAVPDEQSEAQDSREVRADVVERETQRVLSHPVGPWAALTCPLEVVCSSS